MKEAAHKQITDEPGKLSQVAMHWSISLQLGSLYKFISKFIEILIHTSCYHGQIDFSLKYININQFAYMNTTRKKISTKY